MNCTNCGAAMELTESRRFLICRYCGTFNFPDPVDADGVRVVGHLPDAPACPVCDTTLAAAVMDEKPVHFCARCRGILLPRTSFASIVQKRRAWATEPPVEPRPLARKDLERRLPCPNCRRHFDTYPHYGPGNVVIDNCAGCDVIWLDFGEIRSIVEAPGRDRGGRQVVPVDEDLARRVYAEDDDDSPRRQKDLLGALFDLLLK
jgi:Zn-finger nucleic acid-binding protein